MPDWRARIRDLVLGMLARGDEPSEQHFRAALSPNGPPVGAWMANGAHGMTAASIRARSCDESTAAGTCRARCMCVDGGRSFCHLHVSRNSVSAATVQKPLIWMNSR